ncbi:unnamed protein product [[Candida] boidinii]|nr:unnamed protein product [[Candida] boidinii]
MNQNPNPQQYSITPNERANFINIMCSALTKTRGQNFASQRPIAEEFEKWAFENSKNRQQYTDFLKSRITSIQNNYNSQRQQAQQQNMNQMQNQVPQQNNMPGNNNGAGINRQMMPQMSPNQNQSQMFPDGNNMANTK